MANILIVDQSLIIRRVGSCIFEELGCQAQHAPTGAEAVLACKHGAPDLILVDSKLPDMTIQDFSTAIRKSPVGDLVYIIYMAAEIDADTRSSASSLGVDGFLFKPFTLDSMQSMLEDYHLDQWIQKSA